MFEVEAKMRLRDRAALQRRLAALGAEPGPVEHQQDTFFAHPQRDFARTDEALRLRRVGTDLELTYKGPKLAGAAKARLEHAVGVGQDPTALLACLGFVATARLEKVRTPYRWGDIHVALDHLEGLGDFVEVEVLADEASAAARRVEQAVAQLGLDHEAPVRESYLELALRQARS